MSTIQKFDEAPASAGPLNGGPLPVIYSGQLSSGETVSPFAIQSKQSIVGQDNAANIHKVPSGADIKPPSRIQQIANKYIRPQMGKEIPTASKYP